MVAKFLSCFLTVEYHVNFVYFICSGVLRKLLLVV